MELDDGALGGVRLERGGEALSHERLAGTGRAVEDDLLLVLEQAVDLADELLVDEQVVGGLGEQVALGVDARLTGAQQPVGELGLTPRIGGQEGLELGTQAIAREDVQASARELTAARQRHVEGLRHGHLAIASGHRVDGQVAVRVRDGEQLHDDGLVECHVVGVRGREGRVDAVGVVAFAP